jgi:phage/plasmid primase-like uncharacterized protein
MKKPTLLRFVEFVKEHIGSNEIAIADFFGDDISSMAAECNIDWHSTRGLITFNGEKNKGRNVIGMESADKGRVYVFARVKTFEKDGNKFSYPVIDFNNQRASVKTSTNRFNALGRLFDEYDTYKETLKAPKKTSGISDEQAEKIKQVAIKKADDRKEWELKVQSEEPALFDKMRHISEEKAFSTYLQKKKVSDIAKACNVKIGLNEHGYFTCIQLMNTAGEIGCLQRIYHTIPDGWDSNKRVTVGFDPTGFYMLLGEIKHDTEVYYICEGLATGLSVLQATNRPVAVCLFADNIGPVSQALSELHPDKKKVHVADNDNLKKHVGNTGVYKSAMAVKEFGGWVFVPRPSKGSDANDVHVVDGIDVLKAQLKDAENYFNGRFSTTVNGMFNYL